MHKSDQPHDHHPEPAQGPVSRPIPVERTTYILTRQQAAAALLNAVALDNGLTVDADQHYAVEWQPKGEKYVVIAVQAVNLNAPKPQGENREIPLP